MRKFSLYLRMKIAVACLVGMAFGAPARATVVDLQPAYSQIIYRAGGSTAVQSQTGSATLTETTTGPNGAYSNMTVSFQPSPNMIGSIIGTGNGAIAQGSIQYHFSVVGPTNVLVPLIVTASGQLSGFSDANNNTAFLTFVTSESNLFAGTCLFANLNCTYGTDPLSVNAAMSTMSNYENGIFMTLSLVANGTGSVSGFLDPIVQIDPSFDRASEFQLLFSPGVGNSPFAVVPEPGTLALLGSSVIGLGLARRRKAA